MNNKLSIIVKSKSFQQLFGAYQSSFKGSGLSYAGSRVYAPGDPYHRIDRRSSAKKNELFLKEFEEEKIIKLLIVIPLQDSLQFASQTKTKLACLEQMTKLLFAAAAHHHDRVGFLLQNEQKAYFQTAKQGMQQQQLFNRSWKQAQEEFAPQNYNSNLLAAQTLRQQKCKNHCIIWISDRFPQPEDKAIHALAQANEILRIQLFDPFEIEGKLTDPTISHLSLIKDRACPISLDEISSNTYAQQFVTQQTTASKLLSSRHITSLLCKSTQDPLKQLLKLFDLHRNSHYR